MVDVDSSAFIVHVLEAAPSWANTSMSARQDVVASGAWSNLRLRFRRRPKAENAAVTQKQSSTRRWNDNVDAVLASSRISRQRLLGSRVHSILVPFLSAALPILAVLWLLALPLDRWGRTTYFDENAIQPGQVKTFWDWDDVHLADQWLSGIENVWNGGRSSSREYVGHDV